MVFHAAHLPATHLGRDANPQQEENLWFDLGIKSAYNPLYRHHLNSILSHICSHLPGRRFTPELLRQPLPVNPNLHVSFGTHLVRPSHCCGLLRTPGG
jgi:hypothetical protein